MWIQPIPPAAFVADVQQVKALPPVCSVNLSTEEIRTYHSTVSKSEDAFYVNGLGWLFPNAGKSFLQLDFQVSKKLDLPYVPHLKASSIDSWDLIVNGTVIPRSEWENISSYIREGQNTIRLELSSGVVGSSSIESFCLSTPFNPFSRE